MPSSDCRSGRKCDAIASNTVCPSDKWGPTILNLSDISEIKIVGAFVSYQFNAVHCLCNDSYRVKTEVPEGKILFIVSLELPDKIAYIYVSITWMILLFSFSEYFLYLAILQIAYSLNVHLEALKLYFWLYHLEYSVKCIFEFRLKRKNVHPK